MLLTEYLRASRILPLRNLQRKIVKMSAGFYETIEVSWEKAAYGGMFKVHTKKREKPQHQHTEAINEMLNAEIALVDLKGFIKLNKEDGTAVFVKPGKYLRSKLQLFNLEFESYQIIDISTEVAAYTGSVVDRHVQIVSNPSQTYQTRYHLGDGGTLGKSCMNDKDFVEYYDAIDIRSIVVLHNETSKIMARALLWHNVCNEADGSRNLYVDRIYFVDELSRMMIQRYSNDMGALSYAEDMYKYPLSFGEEYADMTIDYYGEIPYLDTFGYCSKGILYSQSTYSNEYEMDSTYGNPEEFADQSDDW